MAQAISKKIAEFNNTCKDARNLVESIKSYINDNHCPRLSMDVSHLNIIEASQVAILCSTYHWAKYPQGKISWKVRSEEVKEIIAPLNLGNIKFVTA